MNGDADAARRVVVPRFLLRFSCIGAACEDNCCAAGWEVAVDEATYTRYQSLDHPLGPALREKVVKKPGVFATRQDFARIALDERRACPFFTPERLCGVQLALGPSLLSNVCRTYPRRTVTIDGAIETGASLSCPEVARLALLDPGAMDRLAVMGTDAPWSPSIAEIATAELSADDPRRMIAAVRAGCLRLAERQDASVDARLLAMGLAFRRIATARGETDGNVEAAFARYDDELLRIESELERLPAEPTVQIELLRELIIDRMRMVGAATGSSRFRRAVDRMGIALRIGDGRAADDETLTRYRAALRDVYEPFIRSRPHILHNYLLSQLHASPFPFSDGRSPLADLALAVARYALLQLLLVGVGAFEGRMTEELFVEVVQPFERAVGHDPRYLRHVLDVLTRSRAITLPSIAGMLATMRCAAGHAGRRVSVRLVRGSGERAIEPELALLRRATRARSRTLLRHLASDRAPLLRGLIDALPPERAAGDAGADSAHQPLSSMRESIRTLAGELAASIDEMNRCAELIDSIVDGRPEKVEACLDLAADVRAFVTDAHAARDRAGIVEDFLAEFEAPESVLDYLTVMTEQVLPLVAATTELAQRRRSLEARYDALVQGPLPGGDFDSPRI
ncbi:MAG TPA: flagellin lysine-N-methylase [Chloroflexota bacterium]|nr:flagellin lysine-N-methylase [Chloroflexota bacterium]